MGEFTWAELVIAVEKIVALEISNRTLDLWDENTITFNLVDKIRNQLSGATIRGDREQVTISAALFKARGTVETRFGDLAVYLKFEYRDATTLSGVAFYEAKKREWQKHTFASIRKDQLTRIHNNLWNARLLVYDHEPIHSRAYEAIQSQLVNSIAQSVLLANGQLVYTFPSTTHESLPFTYAGVIPFGPVLADGRYDRSLYKYALPLSYQLCLRNLQGLDLDHDAETVKAVLGQSKRYGVPRTTLVVVVRHGPGDGAPPLPEFNEEALEPATEQNRRQVEKPPGRG